MTNNEETEPVYFTGSLLIHDVKGQGIDCQYGSGTVDDPYGGTLTIDAGATVNVLGATNVGYLNLGATINGTLIAGSISEAGFITKNTGLCPITVTGSYTLNGDSVSSYTI